MEIVDPYRWLEDQDAPDTRSWLRAQNRYTRRLLDAIGGRETLTQRLNELVRVDSIGVPSERNGRFFYFRRRADEELSVYCMRNGLTGRERVLLDPHKLTSDLSASYTVHHLSKDGKWVLYGVREGGQEETDMRILEVDTGRELPYRLPRAYYLGITLTPDRRGLYYTRMTPDGSRVFYHQLGTNPANDKLIFGEGYSPDQILGCAMSEDGRWLLFYVYQGWARNLLYAHRYNPDQPEVLPNLIHLTEGTEGTLFVDIFNDVAYARTTWNAPNGRVLRRDLSNPNATWHEVIPESERILQSASIIDGKLCTVSLREVRPEVEFWSLEGKPLFSVPMPQLGALAGLSGRSDSPNLFFGFTSFNLPTTLYHYDLRTGRRRVWSRLHVPVRPSDFEVRQVWYTSKDGTRVPMFLAHKKGLKRNGNNPTLLTGYGGFRASSLPYFSAMAVAWMEMGGIWALPNLRGGGEFGEAWHKAGMLHNKQNVFDDFISACEYLIQERYTRPERLAVYGGSNGGLLVGALMTQRPDLVGAVICTYPLLDMLRYHKLLVGSFWIPEYGNPDDPEAFQWLRAYSPYHNVKHGTPYPAVLFVTGDSDTRVSPAHARKMTALLQSATSSGKPVLLLYDTQAGHAGGRPIREIVRETADMLLFLKWTLGIETID